ncbi:MAG: hypothetical protein NZ700_07215 [Gemmataceae bacterium]|nr:hypothetical protein [Gemmataceae bacterium]MDW8266729.1 hypothetical protein [Gemmataceae bacterium]
MWTPKRVLLWLLGVIVFGSGYVVYAFFLGSVDGLPQLPEEFVHRAEPTEPLSTPTVRPETLADQRLRQAFGEECQELKRTIKLEVRAKGVVVAFDQFDCEPDGRVKLAPFSLAVFSKPRGDGGPPEIHSIRSDLAYLTFDRPIVNIADMGKARLVGAELVQDRNPAAEGERRGQIGGVSIVCNRRTTERDDDLSIFTRGPVFYDDNLNRAWTAQAVQLTDLSSRPKPTTVSATGMDIYFTRSTPGGSDGSPRPVPPARPGGRGPGISGVERVTLRGDVDMHLWVDARSDFLGAGKRSADASKPADSPGSVEKSQVVIKTQGPFTYDLRTDRARFDISQHPGPHPNHVSVTRLHDANGAFDQLVCDHLELQFRRKQRDLPPAAGSPASPLGDEGVQLEIESVHATGHQVIITSDAEVLTAFGTDLTYDVHSRQTILSGEPEMVAMKDGNEIYARQLVLVGLGDRSAPQATARGPGRIEIRDRRSGRKTLKARWKDTLLFGREGSQEVLTLTGEAAFEDQEHGQSLQADMLKVWLEVHDAGTTVRTADTKAGQPAEPVRRRPQRVEARGQVAAWAPDLVIHDTDRLLIWFQEAAPAPGQLPPLRPAGNTTPAPLPSRPPEPLPKPKSPIQLSARSIEAHVVQLPAKNELQRLWCEGHVRVRQEPAPNQEKGTDLRGQTLQLNRYPDGNTLVLTGDRAEVHLDKVSIIGPEIHVDQRENQVWVNGVGAMRLPSGTNFHGERLSRTSDLTIYWNRNMFFNGKDAQFYGGIQAEQDHARLACQTLQVFLDRRVSLKEGEKGQPPAKVEKVVCDKSVRIEDVAYQNGRLARYQRIESRELSMDNQEGVVIAPGPGVVRLLAPGNGPGPRPGTVAKPSSPSQEQLRLTRVTYLGRMFANNQTRTAIFYDNVEVVQVPADNPDVSIDVDRLPPGALYLRCDQLKVYSRKDADGRTTQEMEAHRKAVVQAAEFWGRADLIKFDEAKDQVVFEGVGGNLAALYRVQAPGAPPEEIKGRKITYWRRTNEFKIEGGDRIDIRN